MCLRCRDLLTVATLATQVQVNKWSRKLWAAVLAEFLGMTIFEIYGGNAPNSVAAYGNGITLGILGTSLSTLDTCLCQQPLSVSCHALRQCGRALRCALTNHHA